MKHSTFSKWLKCILIGVGICFVIAYSFVIPECATYFSTHYPEFSFRYWPWMIFLWIAGIPCLIMLLFAWKIASNIGVDIYFSNNNANFLKWISLLSAGDSAYFFLGNILMLFLNMNHPSVVLASFVISFIGVSISVGAAVLSHIVQRGTLLQEQSDLTI